MLIKAVPRAIARSARPFHSSAAVSRVVATKAEEVKVLINSRSRYQHALTFVSLLSLLANILSLNMNLMLSSCKYASTSTLVARVSYCP